ncbi:helix-turn-helix transcriptional regulator [uncultured Desulfovibrio sp.]|uniref:helix-turn-helix domain-containing protein n=1 Tax=uncultured Desulfovibrio sp. TaxID=167968 RepID=UPI00344F74BA
METFSARLKEERKRLGLKGIEVAQLVGISRETQSLYENGKRTPDVEYLAKLHSAGFDALYLLTGSHIVVTGPPPLKKDETTLLENYRRASRAIKQAAQAVLASGVSSAIGKTVVVGRDVHGDVNL